MTNPRDTGRWDAFAQQYVDTNVRVDFVWGNIPLQPNDDRGEDTLDRDLDSHIIATDGWSSFPEFVPNAGFDLIVPDLVGMNNTEAQTLLNELGLSPNAQYDETGATSQNNETVKSQSIEPGTVVDPGTTVQLSIYHYVATPVNYTIAGIRKQFDGSSLDYNMFYMFLSGRNHNLANGNTINITGSDVDAYNKNGWIVLDAVDDNAFNTGGTKVTIFWNGVISETANGTGGTYAKV